MKINWKDLAASPGYISLKGAYIKDVQDASKEKLKGRKPIRDKKEFLRHFNWVICRAKHYAYHLGRDVSSVLDEWESKRTYWWLNYYQDCQQPKIR